MGKRGSVRGGKRSSLDFQDQDTNKDQKSKPVSYPSTNYSTGSSKKKIMEVLLERCGTVARVVTKISSCQVNTTSRRGATQLGISFGSIFVLFSNESGQGPHSY